MRKGNVTHFSVLFRYTFWFWALCFQGLLWSENVFTVMAACTGGPFASSVGMLSLPTSCLASFCVVLLLKASSIVINPLFLTYTRQQTTVVGYDELCVNEELPIMHWCTVTWMCCFRSTLTTGGTPRLNSINTWHSSHYLSNANYNLFSLPVTQAAPWQTNNTC